MQSLLGRLVDSIVAMPEAFGDVLANGPVEVGLVLLGTVLIAFSVGVFGYLTLGALVDLVTPDLRGRSPPRAGR